MDDRAFSFLPDYAGRLIRFKARQVCRRPGYSASDRVDVEQDLIIDLLKRLPKYDATKSQLNTFIARIVERKVVSLLRHHGAAKRSRRREACSLNDAVLDPDGRIVDRHETTQEAANVPLRLRDLERDVATVLADMPEILRAVALGLVNGTVNSSSLELGLSRSTVKRHIAELRRRFEDAGLREYL